MKTIRENWTLFCQRSKNNSTILNRLFTCDTEINIKELDKFITDTLSSQENFIESCLQPELIDTNEFIEYLRLIEKENKIIIKYANKAGYTLKTIESPFLKLIDIMRTTNVSLKEKLEAKNPMKQAQSFIYIKILPKPFDFTPSHHPQKNHALGGN